MKKRRGVGAEGGVILLLIIIVVGALGLASYYSYVGDNTEWVGMAETSATYEVYHATAPFGYLYKDFDGRGLLFSWRFNTELEEVIIVKYLTESNELRTIKSDGEWTDIQIVVDGEFYLEKQLQYIDRYEFGKFKERRPCGLAYSFFVLHIPELPKPDYNATRDYIAIS